MLKPNFKPLFYSKLVYDVFTGASRPAVRIATPKTGPKTTVDVNEKDKSLVTVAQLNTVKSNMKSTKESLMARVESELKDKDKVTYRNIRSKIVSYFAGTVTKLHRNMTREELTRVQEAAVKKAEAFRNRIDSVTQLIEYKKTAKERIKKITKEKVMKYVKLRKQTEGWAKEMNLRQVVYVASAYLLRWESVNTKAIDRIIDVDVAKAVSTEVANGTGNLFKDLRAIEGDIMRVFETWALKDGDPRTIYIKSNWDTKYEKDKMPSKILKNLKKHTKTTTSRLKGAGYGAAIGSVIPGAGTVIGAGVGALVGKDEKHKHTPKEKDIKKFLAWARNTKDSNFPPMPRIKRAGGARIAARITAAINPEKLRRVIDFQNRAVDLQQRLNKVAKNKMRFGNITVDPAKKESKIQVTHKGKSIGNVELGADGKIYVAAKKKKIEVASKKEIDVIKTMEDLALNPKVNELKVAKAGGKTTLKILGDNLPTKSPQTMDLAAGRVKLASLSMSRTNVTLASGVPTVDASIKKVLKDSLGAYVKNVPKLGAKVKPKITAKLIEELQQKVYPKGAGKRPQLIIRGTADVATGSFAENKNIADRRAKSAYEALKTKNPNLDKNYDVKIVAAVVDPEGNPVDDKKKGMDKTMELWNKDKKIKEKVTTIAELKAKLKDPTAGAQAQFVKKFEGQRGADMVILPPKTETQSYDIVVGNTTAAPSSVPMT